MVFRKRGANSAASGSRRRMPAMIKHPMAVRTSKNTRNSAFRHTAANANPIAATNHPIVSRVSGRSARSASATTLSASNPIHTQNALGPIPSKKSASPVRPRTMVAANTARAAGGLSAGTNPEFRVERGGTGTASEASGDAKVVGCMGESRVVGVVEKYSTS